MTVKSKTDFEKTRNCSDKIRQLYELPETISIWLCNFSLQKEYFNVTSADYRDEWAVYSKNDIKNAQNKFELQPISNKNKYIIIDLPKFAKSCTNPTTREQTWLSMLTKLNEGFLPNSNDDLFTKALNRLQINLDKNKVNSSEEKLMDTIWDYEFALKEAKEEAKKNAKEAAKAAKQAAKQAAQRAAKIAKAEGIRQTAKTFRDNGVDIDIIVKSTGFTKEEILAL